MAALSASLLLAIAVSTASARRLDTTEQQWRATWASLEFVGEVIITIRCPVTMEGSFHSRTIPKIERLLIGAVTRINIKQNSCVNGIVAGFNGEEPYNGRVPASTLPWHITYESFTGTLPSIGSVRILFSRFRFGVRDAPGGNCTGQYGTAADNVTFSLRLEGRAITEIIPVEMRNIATLSRRDEGIFCPETGRIRGVGTVTLLNMTTRITLTLI
jgi:hypothetical protein